MLLEKQDELDENMKLNNSEKRILRYKNEYEKYIYLKLYKK